MNLISTPSVPIGHHLRRGSASLSIGKIAVESHLDKAQPCHSGGTEVIQHSPLGGYARVEGEFHSSVSVGVFCFCCSSGGWNYNGGKAAFRGQFLEGRQIVVLHIIPATE